MTFFVLLFLQSINLFSNTINIKDKGAIGDGITDNTTIIQNAVNEVSKQGGGTVYIPSGVYLIRPIEFKSNVNLYLSHGATLLGSNILSDYDNALPIKNGNFNQTSGLIWGNGLVNISITGTGTIHGQGENINFQFGNDEDSSIRRPKLIYFFGCKQIKVCNITLQNSAYWVQHYEKCEDIFVHGIRVFSHCNYNNDGLDIDAKNVIISDCYIDVEDDAICLKSDHDSLCENIAINNCIVASNCNAIKLGTATHGGFRNISISNCVVHRAAEDRIRHWSKQLEYISANVTVISGLAIEMVDGGIIDGLTASNITMRDVQTPIFIKLGNRNRTSKKGTGGLKNISIDNIVATAESLITNSITGFENNYVENISISNFRMTFPGGGTIDMANKPVPENSKDYPENRMFGNSLPAAGFYVRHAKNIKFNNVEINSRKYDARPIFCFEDVIGGQINAMRGNSVENLVKQVNCSDIYVDNKIFK